MKKELLILVSCLLIFTGCTNNYRNNNEMNNPVTESSDIKENDVKVSDIKVTINDKTYTLKLEINNTVDEFVNLLPQEFTMSELNNNEKYVYMNDSLATNSYNPKHIEKGDVMLYGNNCLVIFYKSFDTSYNYTKIGHIDNIENLGSGSVTVRFEK